jgi:hypothetical protein
MMPGGFASFFGVGINKYPFVGRKPYGGELGYAAHDCFSVALALCSTRITDRHFILTDLNERDRRYWSEKVKLPIASDPSLRPLRNDIYRGISQFLDAEHSPLQPKRPAIFYFAGHGTTVNGNLHICGSDFDETIPGWSGLNVSEIVHLFSKRTAWTAFVFDCCRSPLRGSSIDSHVMQQGGGVLVFDNSVLVFSCSENQHSYEAASILNGEGGGIFSHFLCKSLRENKKIRKGDLTPFGEIFEAARNETAEYARSHANKDQTPRMLGAQGGEFHLMCKPQQPPARLRPKITREHSN